ncbi:MAG: PD-(D/E)XK nuclease family protein [Helicobacter bilis]|uniref:PDDEXK-like family protein n=1 Tax=Helicobacter bilis TaxID=37372 RepID=UPI0026EE30D1|nr:PD-(D/E)XK nuclease family protein [Helicobacter bilis]MCI7410230.1 PD-(D/E)XK nuclease family protein [Helicobacter bilis]
MEYREFFERVKGFLEQAEIHKRRGNNDFNPYLEMWSESNEVKLHSALISGFLNPLGNHYQGDVFLETFLESVGLKAWFGNTRNARVHKEYKNIDVYITNGERHIIVENKIWAGDQDRQIERYIEIIAKEQSRDSSDTESSEIDSNDMESNELESSESETPQEQGASYDNIAVLYLAPDERNPSGYSLGKWEIQGDYLVNGDNKVRFKAITYKEEILAWIENSQAKVGCITNLNAALLFYKDVVQIITNTKENTMSIENFLTDNKENMQENMEIVFEILKNHESILDKYYNEIISKYKKEIEDNGFEVVKANIGDKNDDWGWSGIWYPYTIKPKDCGKNYIGFGIQCDKKQYISCCLCVRLFGKYTDCQKHRNEYNKITKYLGIEMNGWWLKDRHTDEIETLENELKKFLDSIGEIKALNDKLKDYQG